ncbi:putative poly glycohydrolase family protein [Blattamonas nauphoetae]|uniref:Poly glycohydrolase family protein n=1 Tax=Blattamonas nauphoetae TaxID=2049346 RepID=A0ABQ9YBL5_9EUKA|nr:putative poly glycohydrolase family protein [Blattamonas nauphoetae]
MSLNFLSLPCDPPSLGITSPRRWEVVQQLLATRPFTLDIFDKVLSLIHDDSFFEQALSTCPFDETTNQFDLTQLHVSEPLAQLVGFEEFLDVFCTEEEKDAITTEILPFICDCLISLPAALSRFPATYHAETKEWPLPPPTSLPQVSVSHFGETISYCPLPLLQTHQLQKQHKIFTSKNTLFTNEQLAYPRTVCVHLLAALFFNCFGARKELVALWKNGIRLDMPGTPFDTILKLTSQKTELIRTPLVTTLPEQIIAKTEQAEAVDGLSNELAALPAPSADRPSSPPAQRRTVACSLQNRLVAKMQCILHFFLRVKRELPVGVSLSTLPPLLPSTFSITRRCLHTVPEWQKSTAKLCRVVVDLDGGIEDCPSSDFKVDFANAYLGGGALGFGCVQEEIMFAIAPELFSAMLFTEKLNDREALLIEGAEFFSKYSGYAHTFAFDGPAKQPPSDVPKSRIIVIDALCFSGMMLGNHLHNQWSQCSVDRELNKAFVGFSFVSSPPPSASSSEQPAKRPSLSTGHWGCGAFNGNRVLKFLIQWLAASEAGVEEMRWCAREAEETKLIVDIVSAITQSTPSTSPAAPLSITATNPALLTAFTQTPSPPPTAPSATVGPVYSSIISFLAPYMSEDATFASVPNSDSLSTFIISTFQK